MIIDSMRNFVRYSKLAPEVWEKLVSFFNSISGTIPEPGSHELDGSKLKVNIVHTNTAPAENGKYEVHRQYVDIHIPIRGTETIICRCNSDGLKQIGSFDVENDYVFFEPEPGLDCFLEPGYFLMLYPGEVHHVLTGDGSPIIKAIVKIDISLFGE